MKEGGYNNGRPRTSSKDQIEVCNMRHEFGLGCRNCIYESACSGVGKRKSKISVGK